jgi:hypothetical protein
MPAAGLSGSFISVEQQQYNYHTKNYMGSAIGALEECLRS